MSDPLAFVGGAGATGLHWRERAFCFVKSLSTAVEDSDDEAVVFFSHSTESRLKVVERFQRIGENDLTLVVFHHSVSSVVNHCECLLVGA